MASVSKRMIATRAIKVVDDALDARRRAGLAPVVAVREASLLRLRPIMTTTRCATMGALPVAPGLGSGAELRQPLGVAITGTGKNEAQLDIEHLNESAAVTKILLVEDQPTAAAYLARGLNEEGMLVDLAHNGPDGLHLLLTVHYDLAILDIMLPGLDGWAILETARRARRQTPVLFVTARDAVDDRVRGLELGAEDYLVKPFAFSELLARVRVILRRSGRASAANEPTAFALADLKVDLLKHRAARGADRLELTPKEFALLSLLVRRSGEVQSRTVIADQVWDMNFESDTNIVEVAIRRLRAKLDDPYPLKLLHTVRGVGYVLEVRT